LGKKYFFDLVKNCKVLSQSKKVKEIVGGLIVEHVHLFTTGYFTILYE
jgi:hypothetical protein